jgi:hypothetical protein
MLLEPARLVLELLLAEVELSLSQKSSAALFALMILFLLVVFFLSPRPQAPQRNGSAVVSRLGPADIYPNAALTPGATNSEITQDNIRETICNRHWSTKSIRPPARYTNSLKVEQMREYGDVDRDPRDYEEDHLIPLELGGNPTDPRNLWPEPREASIPEGGASAKDTVERYLHGQVCAGNLSLPQAQNEIARDWYRVYLERARPSEALQ